jgi:ribose 5-phosphate isomerase B
LAIFDTDWRHHEEHEMKIVIGSDPSALKLKQAILKHLEEKGHTVTDLGTTETREVAFYDAAQAVCAAMQEAKSERGILLCGSGMGVAIVAGKHAGIIAACVESVYAARLCRAINNANVLCLGAMIWGESMAKEAVDVFLATQHTDGFPGIKEGLVRSAEEVRKIDERTRRKQA